MPPAHYSSMEPWLWLETATKKTAFDGGEKNRCLRRQSQLRGGRPRGCSPNYGGGVHSNGFRSPKAQKSCPFREKYHFLPEKKENFEKKCYLSLLTKNKSRSIFLFQKLATWFVLISLPFLPFGKTAAKHHIEVTSISQEYLPPLM